MMSNLCKSNHSFLPGVEQSLRNLNRFSKGFTALVSEQVALFVDRALNLAEATIYKPLPVLRGVCDFPEPDRCCPEVACTLIREVFVDERIVEPIQVRNLGKTVREFIFEAGPMQDSEMNAAGTPVVDPKQITLKPGESILLKISYETKSFKQGHRYTSDITIKGHCRQTIRLIAHVTPLEAVRCTVIQREYFKGRRHDWRDHFYCEPRITTI